MIKLFLDDIRNPKSGDWIIVRNFNEFVDYIHNNPMPDLISLDFDLSRNHMKYYFENGGHSNPPGYVLGNPKFEEGTGLDCAYWLCKHCHMLQKPLPVCQVHSANKGGGEAIIDLLELYGKTVENRDIVIERVSPKLYE